jgi:HK97 family phage prohead protease
MRPEQIVIPNLTRLTNHAHFAARVAGGQPGGKVAGLAFANHAAVHAERPALRGYACVYGQTFNRNGTLHAFLPGCFTASLASRRDVKLQLEHDEHIVFGSTASGGLSFVDTDEGLAFEFEIPAGQSGAVAASLVASENRTDVSVGADIIETVTRNFHGHDVRMITRAELREASICKEGAVALSHVRVVDLADSLSLRDELKHGVVMLSARMNENATTVKRTARSIARLKEALEARASEGQRKRLSADATEFMHVRSIRA